jgi:hypothetical protein
MRVIAHHKGIDARDFRKQEREQPQRVHLAKRVCRMRRQQDLLQVVPEFDAGGRVSGHEGQSFFDLPFRGRAKFQAVARHEAKGAQDNLGRSRRLGITKEHQTVDHIELDVRKARPEMLELPVQGGPR